MFSFLRRWRRKRLLKRPFPSEWLQHLERHVPFYRHLAGDLRETFLDRLKVFAWEKDFTGARGMEITDEVRVVISAAAARLILHLDSEYYSKLSEIVVYPFDYKDPDDDGSVIFGEAHPWGIVVLSWPAVLGGIKDPRDGTHTAIHEFAHILDMAEGPVDGTPELRAHEDYRPWAQILGRHYDALCKNQRPERKVLDSYGAKNPAEFFAVATETFFEKPVQMKKSLPDLYGELQRFYGFDPASDGVEGIPSGRKIGRNEPCPCDSGKKYKHCCGKMF